MAQVDVRLVRGEGEPDVSGDRRDAEQEDRGDHGQRGSCLEPEDAWVGERVAGQPLQQGAGHAESGTDGDPDEGAREPTATEAADTAASRTRAASSPAVRSCPRLRTTSAVSAATNRS